MEVPVPTDAEGYLGRECPEPNCESYFKVKPGTGRRGQNIPCFCPYCGHSGPTDHFWTKEQLEYAKSVVLRDITEAVRRDLKTLELEQKPRGPFGVGISMKVEHGPPVPIRYYREKVLETKITCDQCSLDYSVFGLFAYCPDCGVHNSLQILHKNLDLTRKQLILAETLADPDLRRHLIEDALENCVSAFDGFAREACRIRSPKSTDPTKCSSLSFQHLGRAATRLHALFRVDLARAVPAADWSAAHIAFMRRHVLAHRAGVVDQQYVEETGEPGSLLGCRLTIRSDEVRRLTDIVMVIGRHLIGSLPSPH